MAAAEKQDHDQGQDQEEHQELSVRHRIDRPAARPFIQRLSSGYQAGTVAAVPAAVVASAIASVAGWPSPLEATAEVLMQWTPLGIANFILAHLGGIARPAALLGALAVFMLCGGMAGALARSIGDNRTGRALGLLAAALLVSYVMLFLLRPSELMPEIWLVVTFLVMLPLLQLRWRDVSNRREFFERSGIIVGGAAVLVSLFSLQPVFEAIATRRLFPFRPAIGMRLSGISDLVTPPGQFYIMDKVLQYPRLGPPDWQLKVDGAVNRPIAFDYGTLLALPHESRYITMECVDNTVGGRLISNALWTGVRVDHLLNMAGARGDTVVFHGLDSYPESTPAQELVARGALIAFGMNGETLPRAHGYPARLILPGIYGFKSVKWLNRLEVVHGAQSGAWHSHGWSDTAVIHTSTRIDVAHRTGDGIMLAGIAFAGNRGVVAVEVRVNRGPWRRATLGPILSHEVWVQWAIQLHGAGPAHIEVRAIDGNRVVQTQRQHGPYPDGSSGWASATV
jgi:DMSO/TMAO reductase YedYZ molybdopterin-dependent catalytic subunit